MKQPLAYPFICTIPLFIGAVVINLKTSVSPGTTKLTNFICNS
jgi:hypothetical protein